MLAKPLIYLACLLFIFASFMGCNRWQATTLEVSEVKTSIVNISENETILAIAWYTPVDTQCTLSYCKGESLCIASELEPTFGTLHLFICGDLSKDIKYFIIRATDKNGETIEESFDNPLTK